MGILLLILQSRRIPIHKGNPDFYSCYSNLSLIPQKERKERLAHNLLNYSSQIWTVKSCLVQLKTENSTQSLWRIKDARLRASIQVIEESYKAQHKPGTTYY